MENKILIVDEVHQILIDVLIKNKLKFDYFPKISLSESLKIASKYTGVIIRSKFKIDKNFIDIAENLEIIGRVGAGIENIDIEYCKKKTIKIVNSPEGNRDAVGEHAIMMLLSLFNKLQNANLEIKNGIWNRESNRGIELSGKTVGIIGYGNMGSAFAEKLSGFNVNVIAYDKYKTNYSSKIVKETSLKELFESCDIVSVHTTLTNETNGMINSEFINNFKKNIYFINTARGAIVNTNELVAKIKSGKIIGACLDVLEYEKLNFENIFNSKENTTLHYLLNSKNVILSPHVAGWTNESYYKISKIIADKFFLFYKA